MAILARLGFPFLAVRASEPFSERVVNNRTLKDSKMARSAELAAFLKLGVCVLARGYVVHGPGKKLMSLKRPPEFIGKHSGSFWKRKPCGGIEADIPDFVAEIAVDAFRSNSLERHRIGIEGIVDRGHWSMAGGAVARMVCIIKFVPWSIIGRFGIRGKLNKPGVAREPIAGCRAPAA